MRLATWTGVAARLTELLPRAKVVDDGLLELFAQGGAIHSPLEPPPIPTLAPSTEKDLADVVTGFIDAAARWQKTYTDWAQAAAKRKEVITAFERAAAQGHQVPSEEAITLPPLEDAKAYVAWMAEGSSLIAGLGRVCAQTDTLVTKYQEAMRDGGGAPPEFQPPPPPRLRIVSATGSAIVEVEGAFEQLGFEWSRLVGELHDAAAKYQRLEERRAELLKEGWAYVVSDVPKPRGPSQLLEEARSRLTDWKQHIETWHDEIRPKDASLADAKATLEELEAYASTIRAWNVPEVPWNQLPNELRSAVQSLREQADHKGLQTLRRTLASAWSQVEGERQTIQSAATKRRADCTVCIDLAKRHGMHPAWKRNLEPILGADPMAPRDFLALCAKTEQVLEHFQGVERAASRAEAAGKMLDHTVEILEAVHPWEDWQSSIEGAARELDVSALQGHIDRGASFQEEMVRTQIGRIPHYKARAEALSVGVQDLTGDGVTPGLRESALRPVQAVAAVFSKRGSPEQVLQEYIRARIEANEAMRRVQAALLAEAKHYKQEVERNRTRISHGDSTELQLKIAEYLRAVEVQDFATCSLLRRSILHVLTRAIFPKDCDRNLVYQFAKELETHERKATGWRGSS
jgi:hypothetical protein